MCFLTLSRVEPAEVTSVSPILHKWFLVAISGTEKHKKQSPRLYPPEKEVCFLVAAASPLRKCWKSSPFLNFKQFRCETQPLPLLP